MPRVVVYTTTWCFDCHAAKSFLKTHGIEYEEVNIDKNPEAMQLVLMANNGKRSVPTLDIDGAFYNCSRFGPEKRRMLAEALHITM